MTQASLFDTALQEAKEILLSLGQFSGVDWRLLILKQLMVKFVVFHLGIIRIFIRLKLLNS